VRLVVDVDPNIGVTMADPDRLQQIAWNLLTNAVRFTPRGGRVTITADRADSGIKIVVADTGAGVTAENLPFLFERFKPVDSSTTRSHGGLGLGLAIVRHLAEAHGGSAKVASDGLGRGTAFTIILPIRAVNSVRPDPMEKPRGLSSSAAGEVVPAVELSIRDVHVLVVDDDQDSLEILRDLLERAGGRVTVADSAEAALASINAGGMFELIISDIGMPEVDGYGFIRRVRAIDSTADVPAIALTAYARAIDVEAARRAGFQQHLAKPVDEEQLINAVRAWARPSVASAAGV
jgi:CheY-like chemotaxis protein